MRFSELYGITRASADDWFDTLLIADTRLYVDPFRIYVDEGAGWAGAHENVLAFFAAVLTLVKESQGRTSSPPWTKAKSLLLFPEPAEFCLGMAEGSSQGSGSGGGLQRDMLEGARVAVGLGIERVQHMEMLVLFQEGIGVDRISDITCNVLKSFFIKYTQEVGRRHGVAMKSYRVRHSSWDSAFLRWVDAEHELPENPFANGPVLLVPQRFLRQIPTVDPADFWDYAWSNEGEQLRGDFNYDLGKHVPAHVRARLARQNPDVAARYLEALESNPKPAYDADRDPALVTRWYEGGATVAASNPLSMVPKSVDDFPAFIASIIEAFSHGLEESDVWRLLWDGTKHRNEKAVQSLFRSTVLHYCRANHIDLSGESNAGRGPVDFKFAANWQARALVEMKLTDNSGFWDGLQSQTVQYLKSEEIKVGFFVAVGFKDRDFEDDRMQRVRDVAVRVSKETGKDVRVAFVDARPKDSASKLRAPKGDE